jgi:DMSO/TMAO reductase YedYZ molybdopterin-dependent catalytic subunit
MQTTRLPPGQQLVAREKWPVVGERAALVDSTDWSVSIGGLVEAPHTLTLAQLHALPQVERVIDIHCVTRWSKPAVHFTGAKLTSLLDLSRPTAAVKFVSFVARSARSHSTTLTLEAALALDPLVAFAAEGTPLAPEHGGPVRLVVPDRYFYKSLKWLARVELMAEDQLGFWERTAGYHNTADPWREQRYIASGLTKQEANKILQLRDVAGLEVRGLDARGRELDGLVATGALLRNADFRQCRLRRARFEGANLSNSHFQGADLRQASFQSADLEGADFSGADLRGACLLGVRLCGTSFCNPAASDDGAGFDEETRFDLAAADDLTPEQRAYVLTTIGRTAL